MSSGFQNGGDPEMRSLANVVRESMYAELLTPCLFKARDFLRLVSKGETVICLLGVEVSEMIEHPL